MCDRIRLHSGASTFSHSYSAITSVCSLFLHQQLSRLSPTNPLVSSSARPKCTLYYTLMFVQIWYWPWLRNIARPTMWASHRIGKVPHLLGRASRQLVWKNDHHTLFPALMKWTTRTLVITGQPSQSIPSSVESETWSSTAKQPSDKDHWHHFDTIHRRCPACA